MLQTKLDLGENYIHPNLCMTALQTAEKLFLLDFFPHFIFLSPAFPSSPLHFTVHPPKSYEQFKSEFIFNRFTVHLFLIVWLDSLFALSLPFPICVYGVYVCDSYMCDVNMWVM